MKWFKDVHGKLRAMNKGYIYRIRRSQNTSRHLVLERREESAGPDDWKLFKLPAPGTKRVWYCENVEKAKQQAEKWAEGGE